jgi:hypothetical protein
LLTSLLGLFVAWKQSSDYLRLVCVWSMDGVTRLWDAGERSFYVCSSFLFCFQFQSNRLFVVSHLQFFSLFALVVCSCTVASLIDVSNTATWLNYYCGRNQLNNQECSNMRYWICSGFVCSSFLIFVVIVCILLHFISSLLT